MTNPRLEVLRWHLRQENITYDELAELQTLIPFIDPGDTELLEAAGVEEFDDGLEETAETQFYDWKQAAKQDAIDAVRYRKLREACRNGALEFFGAANTYSKPDDFDRAVDAFTFQTLKERAG